VAARPRRPPAPPRPVRLKSKRVPPKHDVWVTEIRVKKPLPKPILDLIAKYETLEEARE